MPKEPRLEKLKYILLNSPGRKNLAGMICQKVKTIYRTYNNGSVRKRLDSCEQYLFDP